MNYKRIHDEIISRAQRESRVKTKESYYEKHHIVPKCLGGNNEKENLVLLTAREHFLIHWLLAEIHGYDKLWAAVYMMAKMDAHGHRYITSSRIVEYSKLKANKLVSKLQTGKLWSDAKKLKSSLSKKGKPCHPNTLKAVLAQKNRYVFSKEILKELSDKRSKKINQYDLKGNFIKEHSSISEASRAVNGNFSNISSCCRKLQETSYGYRWQYA